jgi:hypothetical protein
MRDEVGVRDRHDVAIGELPRQRGSRPWETPTAQVADRDPLKEVDHGVAHHGRQAARRDRDRDRRDASTVLGTMRRDERDEPRARTRQLQLDLGQPRGGP